MSFKLTFNVFRLVIKTFKRINYIYKITHLSINMSCFSKRLLKLKLQNSKEFIITLYLYFKNIILSKNVNKTKKKN